MKKIFTFCISVLLTCSLFAQEKPKSPASETTKNVKEMPPPVVTPGQVSINGKTISYTATTGYLTLKDEKGNAKANVFFIAYTQNGVSNKSKRPITFTFNGGPGSASVWLHMGCIGPKRVLMGDSGEALKPPYQYVNNDYSWLDKTDLVFIDPVTTGYSRAAGDENDKQFHGYEEDIQSVGQFIHLYTSKYDRWGSPKFLAGESYGTTRAAGLSGYLQDRYNMYLNGITLISSVLNFQTLKFDRGNDLPYILYLPTYTATAWYHKKLDADLQTDLSKTLNEVRSFAINEYSNALMKGDMMTDAERSSVIQKLARYTGLSQQYIEQTNLRINIMRFTKQLMRNEGETVGRLDSRFIGHDFDNAGESFEYDPSLNGTISGPYSACLNSYIRGELKFESDLPYEILTGRVQPWNYNNAQNQYLNVAETLRSAMVVNPSLKVWVSFGYYDLATPFLAAEYTLNHMGLKPEQRKNITTTYYEAGHMMYINKPSLIQLKKDADKFYEESLK